jgi:uncharacterized membrane protein
MAFYTVCGAQMPDGSTICPTCSRSGAPGARPAAATPAGLTDNVAGALAYLFIPAIVFLVVEPYNKNRFIRFHSFQSIILGVALWILNYIITRLFVGDWLSALNGGFTILHLVNLAEFVLWVALLAKAYQGQMFKLPVIGDIAEKQAGA